MKSIILIIFALLVFAPAFAGAQTLPSLFEYEKTESGDGSYIYNLKPVAEEIVNKYGTSSPFQIVGATVGLAKQKAVLVFLNAQKEYQFAAQSDKSVTIIADSNKIQNLEYKLSKQSQISLSIKFEGAFASMSYADFEKIMKADSVTVKFGAVTYQLDKENIQALHYFAEQLAKEAKNTNRSGAPQ